jgi:hypothetical protein
MCGSATYAEVLTGSNAALPLLPLDVVDGAVTSAPPIRHHINLPPSQPPTLQLCALVFPLKAHYNHLTHTSKPTLHDIASCSSSRLKFQPATAPDVQKSPCKRLPPFKKPPSEIRGWSAPPPRSDDPPVCRSASVQIRYIGRSVYRQQSQLCRFLWSMVQ